MKILVWNFFPLSSLEYSLLVNANFWWGSWAAGGGKEGGVLLTEWFWVFSFVFLVSVKCLCLLRREGNLCMLTHVFMLPFKLISHLASDKPRQEVQKGTEKIWLCGCICRTHFWLLHVSWIPSWTWTWKSLNSQKPELSVCIFLWLSRTFPGLVIFLV